MKLKISLFFAFVLLVCQPVYAIKVSGLYQATAPVSDESIAKRKPAIKQALIQVLIKLTGNRNIAQSGDISGLLEQSDRFVQQFRYQQQQNSSELAAETDEIEKELWVRFDEATLNNAMRNYGLTIWGKERPSILVWLAHEKDNSRRLVSFEESPEYIAMLDQHAASRGVSLLFPLLDLEDTSKLKVSDVWASFEEPLLNASSRYEPDVVLSAKLTQTTATLWESQWTIYNNGTGMSWTSQGELAEIALEEGINELADRLANEYVTSVTGGTEMLELTVTGVKSVDDYAKALAYLQSIQAVTDVQVKHVKENEVLFKVISHGGITAINKTIALGRTLEQLSNNEQLDYRLIR
ncbi:MAG: DUF2066 domain-containing protein [Gammaproteobacteria bacterium]|jgi:hypothetical protein